MDLSIPSAPPDRVLLTYPGDVAPSPGAARSLLLCRGILRDLGIAAEALAFALPDHHRGMFRPIDPARPSAAAALVIEHTGGSTGGWRATVPAERRILIHSGHGYPQGLAPCRPEVACGAIGFSGQAAAELAAAGLVGPIAVLPIVADVERWERQPPNPLAPAQGASPSNHPRIALTGEGPASLARGERVARALRDLYGHAVELVPLGATSDNALMCDEDVATRLETVDVLLVLDPADADVGHAVQAAALGVPVVVVEPPPPGTLAMVSGPLSIGGGDSGTAGLLHALLTAPDRRLALKRDQRRRLWPFRRSILTRQMHAFLAKLGLDLPRYRPTRIDASVTWRIEGPQEGSYSLAAVNRVTAAGMARQWGRAACRTMDGHWGDFPAEGNADQSCATTAVALRNAYPPRTDGLRGTLLQGLACYAWEKNGFPAAWAVEFNRRLDVITVTSRHVEQLLRNAGVRVPIAVVGLPVEALGRPLSSAAACRPFRFLHISSGLSRKGIDVLLAAWKRAFGSNDQVELLLKVEPNPFLALDTQLERWREAAPDSAPVRLIQDDLPKPAVEKLIEECDAIVLPARAEGFCLPAAEAMVAKKPVITTAFGGQTDFCDARTAWMVGFTQSPAPGETPGMLCSWAEPSVDELVAQLVAVSACSPEERRQRCVLAARRVSAAYTSRQVAARQVAACVEALMPRRPRRAPRIGIVSTWNVHCGIATYARDQLRAFPRDGLRIYGNRASDLTAADTPEVFRVWEAGWNDDLSGLLAALVRDAIDAVVLQFNVGLFDLGAFARLVNVLRDQGRAVFVVMHTTSDYDLPARYIRIGDLAPALQRATRVIVHGVRDLERLRTLGVSGNVVVLPHGFPPVPCGTRPPPRRSQTERPVVAAFGFLMPHKGIKELIRAVALLHAAGSPVAPELLLLNARYPLEISATEEAACRALLDELHISDVTTFETRFLPEADVMARLRAEADLVVFPYQSTQESASGAVRLAVASAVPVAVTPLEIFDDVLDCVFRFSGTSPSIIAEEMQNIILSIRHNQHECDFEKIIFRFLKERNWGLISHNIYNIIRDSS